MLKKNDRSEKKNAPERQTRRREAAPPAWMTEDPTKKPGYTET